MEPNVRITTKQKSWPIAISAIPYVWYSPEHWLKLQRNADDALHDYGIVWPHAHDSVFTLLRLSIRAGATCILRSFLIIPYSLLILVRSFGFYSFFYFLPSFLSGLMKNSSFIWAQEDETLRTSESNRTDISIFFYPVPKKEVLFISMHLPRIDNFSTRTIYTFRREFPDKFAFQAIQKLKTVFKRLSIKMSEF